MLKVEGLRVAYGRIAAVKHVSFHVDEGEIVGMIGRNGAGKSTTLLAVAGAVPTSAGNVTFKGSSIVGRRPEDIVKLGLALVPEGRHIFAKLTVRENLLVGAASRRDRNATKRDLSDLMDRFPVLRNNQHRAAGTLSGGEQQQLAIARTLMARPQLLMLDEPSLGLAPKMVDLVFNLITSLRAGGTTILLVEQLVQKTLGTVDRVYVLQQGEIKATGRPSDLIESGEVQMAYLGRR